MTSKVTLAFMAKQLKDETALSHEVMKENHNLRTKLAQANLRIADLESVDNIPTRTHSDQAWMNRVAALEEQLSRPCLCCSGSANQPCQWGCRCCIKTEDKQND